MEAVTPEPWEVRLAWQEYAFKDDGSHQDKFDNFLRAYAEGVYDEAFENFGDALQTPADGTTTQEFRKAVIAACIAQGNPYRQGFE